ncbi:MAG: metal-dependent transcriptional regulator [Pontimonas sp.]|jgi:DtxR family Mn-dependent transcriptional regulator
MTDLIDTTEMYLKAILELEEEGITPMRARISERLAHSGPTVSQTVARMERDGLLSVEEDRTLKFTDEGRLMAIEVMRKHRLAELLLLEVIGLSWEQVHEEACRWEHVMSEAVERRLLELLKTPTHSPFGMPIPGLELLGMPASQMQPAVAVPDAEPGTYQVARIGEPVQVDEEFLHQLAQQGILPGSTVVLAATGGGWLLRKADSEEGILLDEISAQHLFLSVSQ